MFLIFISPQILINYTLCRIPKIYNKNYFSFQTILWLISNYFTYSIMINM